MKKIIIFAAGFFLALGLYAQTINPKIGYVDLKWGATVDDVKRSGYKMTPKTGSYKQFVEENFLPGTEAYNVEPKESFVTGLTFLFYNGKLFYIDEIIPEREFLYWQLEIRYGQLSKIDSNDSFVYSDVVIDSNGKQRDCSVVISLLEENYIITLLDWQVYLLAKKQNTTNLENSKKVTSPKKKSDSLWKIQKSRNDFDGYTDFGFYLEGPRGKDYYLFVGYRQFDNPAKSFVRSGIYWNGSYSTFDIKDDTGQIHNEKLPTSGSWEINGKTFRYSRQDSARLILGYFFNNNILTLRCNNIPLRFQTAGLLDRMAEYGITWDKLDNAISNEEF